MNAVLECNRDACGQEELRMANQFFGVACLSAVGSEWEAAFAACPAWEAFIQASFSDTTRELSADLDSSQRVSFLCPLSLFPPCPPSHQLQALSLNVLSYTGNTLAANNLLRV